MSQTRRLAHRQAQTREQQLAVLRIAKLRDRRNHNRRDGTEAPDDVPRFVELSQQAARM